MASTHTGQTGSQQRPRSQERRGGTQSAIDKLVTERTEMLTLFCRLAGLEPFEQSRHRTPPREVLQEFLQVLVDYLAAGHFSLYDRITNNTERRRPVASVASDLYSKISQTTQAALDFNDKYDGDQFVVSSTFHDDLSRLGELLASRIELEDKIIGEVLR